jgi:hypothetical protein
MKQITSLLLVSTALAISACGEGGSSVTADARSDAEGTVPVNELPQGSEPANLDPSEFTTQIDNPYLPLTVGSRWVYRETEDGEPDQKVVVEVTGKTKQIANGVKALVVRDTVTQGGELVELTDDWYAQDAEGNVWYLGEDTAEYENGKRVCRCGSFEAGVDGAEPGVIMPANPQVGMEYRQEFYEGEAEDEGKVLSLDEMAEVPMGHYAKTLMTRDTNPLEPKVSEHKFFAEGVGLVLALKHSGGEGREELVSFTPGK